jgi:SAM-dependent methyltransferase
MDDRISRVAALANKAAYDADKTADYSDSAPHIKHLSLRTYYGKLVVDLYDFAAQTTERPRVLDLGAGEGSVTLPFLELGAEVRAVDISESQLAELERKCTHFRGRLEVHCGDANQFMANRERSFDIIAINSFLHHVPDYLEMVRNALPLLGPDGQLFTFQDPLRYDTLGKIDHLFTRGAYYCWRVGKHGDLLGGLRRFFRRKRGVYLDDCEADNTEYHVVRNGVDQLAIESLVREQGFDCEIFSYYSTQLTLFQHLGAALGIKNSFGLIARRIG